MKSFLKNLETTTFMMMFIIVANIWFQRIDAEVFDSNMPIAAYWIVCTIAGTVGKMVYDDYNTWIKEAIRFIRNRSNRVKYIKKT